MSRQHQHRRRRPVSSLLANNRTGARRTNPAPCRHSSLDSAGTSKARRVVLRREVALQLASHDAGTLDSGGTVVFWGTPNESRPDEAYRTAKLVAVVLAVRPSLRRRSAPKTAARSPSRETRVDGRFSANRRRLPVVLGRSALRHRGPAGRLGLGIPPRVGPRAAPIQQEIEQRPVKPTHRRDEDGSYPQPHPPRERHVRHASKLSCRVNAGSATKSSHSCDVGGTERPPWRSSSRPCASRYARSPSVRQDRSRFAKGASPCHPATRHGPATEHDRCASAARSRGPARRCCCEGARRRRRHGAGRWRRGLPRTTAPRIQPAPLLGSCADSASSRGEGPRARQGSGASRTGIRAAVAA